MNSKYLTELRKRDGTLIHGVSKCLNSLIPAPQVPSHIDAFLKDNRKCSYCFKALRAKKKAAGDHVISLVRDKMPIITNLHTITIPACSDCNGSKSNCGIIAYMRKKQLPQSDDIAKVLDYMKEHGKVYTLPKELWDKIVDHIDYRGLVPLVEFLKTITIDQYEQTDVSIEELLNYEKHRSKNKKNMTKTELIDLAGKLGIDTYGFHYKSYRKATILAEIQLYEDEDE